MKTSAKTSSSSQAAGPFPARFLSFRFRRFSLRFSSFDTFPCGGHGVGASSITEPSDSLFFSSPCSRQLELSARFVPTVPPLTAAQQEEGAAEEPGWEGRGGGQSEGDGTAVDEDTNATVDTVGEDVDGGELEGVRVEGGEGGGLPNRTAAGVEGGGEGRVIRGCRVMEAP